MLSKGDRPALTGAMNFKAEITVPAGDRNFIQRVDLTGDFGISAASFTRPATQKNVDNLSRLAKGEKEDSDPGSVIENLKGQVVLKDAIARFTSLSFSVPGAQARMHGTYALLNERIDLHGTLQVDNKLSKGTGGMKSFLLKSFEPFLKKKEAGEVVPIKIDGTFAHPSYGLDLTP
jgi:hypothetical protein